jgi:hypothetical protein
MYRSMRGATKRSERVFCVYERCLRIRLRPRQHRSPADKAQQGLPCWVCATVVPRRCGRIGKTIAVSCAAQPSWSRLVYGAYPPPCGPCGLHRATARRISSRLVAHALRGLVSGEVLTSTPLVRFADGWIHSLDPNAPSTALCAVPKETTRPPSQ